MEDEKKYQLLIHMPFAKRGSIWRITNEKTYGFIYPSYRHNDIIYKKGTEPKLFIGNRKGIIKSIYQYSGFVSRQGLIK